MSAENRFDADSPDRRNITKAIESDERTQLGTPIKVTWDGTARSKIENRCLEADSPSAELVVETTSRLKTRLVCRTAEEAAAVLNELANYGPARSWLNPNQSRTLRRVENEVVSALEERRFDVVQSDRGLFTVFEQPLVADGGQPTLRYTDDGVEIPEDVDFSEGVVFRARGATIDHKPGDSDRDFYPLIDKDDLTAEGRGVQNDHLQDYQVSIKPYGEEATTYEVAVPATDGGLIEHPGLDAVAAEEYEGAQGCDYGCGSVAEYLVELRLEASSTTSLVCDDCSQEHKLWVQENDLLENTAYVDPLAKIAGQTEVEITCAIGQDTPRACDGWAGTVELDEPARCVNGRIKLPGFDWECPECGNPSEFEVDGTRVSRHV